ncbi:MAG: AIR carboxylase family protein, partial [Ignavibacteriae bacterium]|nr:AIR carboxylase family protein [Ignavibacteriota bacterium]
GQTVLPVIGVPMKSNFQDGLDSLLSIVQMPPGIPVATVTINGAKNAALLAIQIIATGDKDLQKKFVDYKSKMAEESMQKNDKIKDLK